MIHFFVRVCGGWCRCAALLRGNAGVDARFLGDFACLTKTEQIATCRILS